MAPYSCQQLTCFSSTSVLNKSHKAPSILPERSENKLQIVIFHCYGHIYWLYAQMLFLQLKMGCML